MREKVVVQTQEANQERLPNAAEQSNEEPQTLV